MPKLPMHPDALAELADALPAIVPFRRKDKRPNDTGDRRQAKAPRPDDRERRHGGRRRDD